MNKVYKILENPSVKCFFWCIQSCYFASLAFRLFSSFILGALYCLGFFRHVGVPRTCLVVCLSGVCVTECLVIHLGEGEGILPYWPQSVFWYFLSIGVSYTLIISPFWCFSIEVSHTLIIAPC